MNLFKNSISKPLLLLVLIPILCCVTYLGYISVREYSHNLAIEHLSRKLEIPPSWNAFHDYIFDRLKPGTSRNRVIEILNAVSPYEVVTSSADNCEQVNLKPGILNITSYSLLLCYEADKDRALQRVILYDW